MPAGLYLNPSQTKWIQADGNVDWISKGTIAHLPTANNKLINVAINFAISSLRRTPQNSQQQTYHCRNHCHLIAGPHQLMSSLYNIREEISEISFIFLENSPRSDWLERHHRTRQVVCSKASWLVYTNGNGFVCFLIAFLLDFFHSHIA